MGKSGRAERRIVKVILGDGEEWAREWKAMGRERKMGVEEGDERVGIRLF